jgi:isopenicillin N synthase-like dioxygenase
VEKRQAYRLSESRETDEFDLDYRIKTCDIGRFLHGNAHDRTLFAMDLRQALEEIGFAILEGHGIAQNVYDRADAEVERMFTQHSLERKLDFRARRHGSINQGYFPLEETSDIHPDLVEGWVFCRRAFDLDGDPRVQGRLGEFWPDLASERVFREVCRRQEALILPVMQSILSYLECDPHLYDRRLTSTHVGLRLNYYPPIDPERHPAGAGRLLGHEDVDLFTFLPAPRSEGLQVLNRKNFRWIRLNAPPGSIILNTGDYMQRITNDILPSTTHRVSRPIDKALERQARVSFPMNIYLWEEDVLEVLPGLFAPKYEPIQAIRFHTQITSKYYGDSYAVDAEGG